MTVFSRMRRWALTVAAIPCVASLGIAASTARAAELSDPREVMSFIQLLQGYSYDRLAVSDQDWSRIIPLFLEKLDPERVYFSQADLNLLTEKFGVAALLQVRKSGDLTQAIGIFDQYKIRVRERVSSISRLLDSWHPNEDASCSFMRASAWAPDQQALDELWKQRLQSEWALSVARGGDPKLAVTLLKQHYQSFQTNVESRPKSEVCEQHLNCLASLYDSTERTRYYSGETYSALLQDMELKMVSIGATLSEDQPKLTILSTIPGGPAAKCNRIHAGDRLVSVQQSGRASIDVAGLTTKQVTRCLQGELGTDVTLVIEHPDSLQRETVVLTRDRVCLDRAVATIFDLPSSAGKNLSLGVIRLGSLYGKVPETDDKSASEDVLAIIKQLNESQVTGLVLDLRGNGGGLLTEATEVAGIFLGDLPVLCTKDYRSVIDVLRPKRSKPAYQGHVVVLVDHITASGAEIIAGTLRDYQRAVIVGGSRTAGSGTIQTVVDLRMIIPSMKKVPFAVGAAKLTIQHFYLPSGVSTQNHGITPDFALPDSPFAARVEIQQPAGTRKPDAISPLELPAGPVTKAELLRLKAAHDRRKKDDAGLQFLERWTTTVEKFQQVPGGTLADVRNWIVERISMQTRFESESRQFAQGAYSRHELNPLDSNPKEDLPPGEHGVRSKERVTKTQDESASAVDIQLQEALRVLADMASPSQSSH